VVDTTPPPPVPQKQLITITTTSPDAKAAFLKALSLMDNGRDGEALDQCKLAVAADPAFAFGHSCVGNVTPGAEGQAELDKGADLAAKLPDAERLFIEGWAALRHQDTVKGFADMKRVAELAPDDVHAQLWLGYTLINQRDFKGAEAAFTKVLDLDPSAVFIQGALAWTHMQLREYDAALAAAQKYVDGAPNEAAAHQTVAMALLNLNKTKEADAELSKAVELGPKARPVYYDLASVKAIEGDFAGARDALERSKGAEALPSQALERATRTAWVLFAAGKNSEAFAVLDAAEKDSDARKLVWPASAASARAWALWVLGKPADAQKVAEAAMPRCDRPESSAAYKADCRRDLLTIQALAQLQSKKVADAKKTVAKLQDETKNWQGNEWVSVEVDMLSDQVAALASKDAKAAAAVLAKCPPDDFLFKLGILRQIESAGDKAAAEQVRKDVLGRPLTDPQYALVARVANAKK
jgi:Flp pilus assembly protein TadD